MVAEVEREDDDVEGLMGQFRAYLTKKGLKSTRQRDIIATRFFASPGHLSIEALLGLAREEYPKVGYATVYRTLKLLTECGLAAERRFGEGQTMYETAGDLEHHDHLICVECGHVLEFHNEDIEREQERVARSFGFNVIRHRHELYGLCPRARGIKGGSCPGQAAQALATVAAAAAWLLLRFIRRPATCDGCDAPRVRRPTRGIRPAAMKVLHRDAGPR